MTKRSKEEQLAALREIHEPAIGPNPEGLVQQARNAQDRPDDEPAPDPAGTSRRVRARRGRKARADGGAE